MRRRIEALADQVEEFVSQDGHDALIVNGDGHAAGVVGAAVDLAQQRGSLDVSFAFFDPFAGVEAFAEKMIADVEAFATGAKLAPLAPALVGRPIDRLIGRLLVFASAVRARGDVRVAIWIVPSAIADEDAYLGAVLELVRASRRCDPPLRIAAREACADERPLRAALRRAGSPTLEVAVDLSPTAIRDALAEEAADPSVDPSTRAAALLSCAMADVASGRAAEAVPILVGLAHVFEAAGDASSRALSFVCVGNALAALGQLTDARARVSQGLAIAVEARAIPVVLAGAMLAGHLSMRAGDAADADVRFDVAARIAARLGSPLVVAQALLERGRALEARGMPSEARDAWVCAAEAGRRAQSVSHERAAWEAVARTYREAGMADDAAPIEARVALLGAPAAAACAHEHAP